jgi:hypothetical protein
VAVALPCLRDGFRRCARAFCEAASSQAARAIFPADSGMYIWPRDIAPWCSTSRLCSSTGRAAFRLILVEHDPIIMIGPRWFMSVQHRLPAAQLIPTLETPWRNNLSRRCKCCARDKFRQPKSRCAQPRSGIIPRASYGAKYHHHDHLVDADIVIAVLLH